MPVKYLDNQNELDKWNSLYVDMKRDKGNLAESNDCAVIALAMVCGVPYKKAHHLCAKRGRMPNKETTLHIIQWVLHERRLKTVDVTDQFPGDVPVAFFHDYHDMQNTYLVHTHSKNDAGNLACHMFAVTPGMANYLCYSSSCDKIVKIEQVVVDFDRILV